MGAAFLLFLRRDGGDGRVAIAVEGTGVTTWGWWDDGDAWV
jgi:hypothetical protein